MSILTQDSKVLVNDSGEVYKTAPIIDISSTYGVTKDGSNLVSKVKILNKPSIIRCDVGKQPIENGGGFEFSDSIRNELIVKVSNAFKNISACTLLFEGKLKSETGTKIIFTTDSLSTPKVEFYFSNLTFNIYANGGEKFSHVFTSGQLTNAFWKMKVLFDSSYLRVYFNEVPLAGSSLAGGSWNDNDNIQVGGISRATWPLNGFIKTFTMYDYVIHPFY